MQFIISGIFKSWQALFPIVTVLKSACFPPFTKVSLVRKGRSQRCSNSYSQLLVEPGDRTKASGFLPSAGLPQLTSKILHKYCLSRRWWQCRRGDRRAAEGGCQWPWPGLWASTCPSVARVRGWVESRVMWWVEPCAERVGDPHSPGRGWAWGQIRLSAPQSRTAFDVEVSSRCGKGSELAPCP